MPLVRIDLLEGRSQNDRHAIGEAIYQALLSIGVPTDDRFQVITEHARGGLIFDPGYLDIVRTDGFVMVQITFNAGRTLDQKTALFKAIVDECEQRVGIRPEDIMISLIEVPKENWSYGNGEAQYAV